MKKKNEQERTSRPLPDKIHTAVGAEVQDEERGSIHLCHGYDLYNDLLGRYSWLELTILHLRGELPSREEADVFDLIFRIVINPGPKNWATQAAMTAAVTHTPVGNSLLAGLAVLEGRYHGALAVEKAMEMFAELVVVIHGDCDRDILTGIVSRYGDLPGFDRPERVNGKRVNSLVDKLSALSSHNDHIQAALEFGRQQNVKLTLLGLFAAALCDLGFAPRQGHGLFLIAAAPGILAHLLEQMEGSWSSYPFGSPPEYVGPQDKTLSDEQRCYGKSDE